MNTTNSITHTSSQGNPLSPPSTSNPNILEILAKMRSLEKNYLEEQSKLAQVAVGSVQKEKLSIESTSSLSWDFEDLSLVCKQNGITLENPDKLKNFMQSEVSDLALFINDLAQFFPQKFSDTEQERQEIIKEFMIAISQTPQENYSQLLCKAICTYVPMRIEDDQFCLVLFKQIVRNHLDPLVEHCYQEAVQEGLRRRRQGENIQLKSGLHQMMREQMLGMAFQWIFEPLWRDSGENDVFKFIALFVQKTNEEQLAKLKEALSAVSEYNS